MNTCLDIKVKPYLAEGTIVQFNYDDTIKGTGVIRGKASEHIIDMWIVEVRTVTGLDKNTYPWSCVVVPHTLLEVMQ